MWGGLTPAVPPGGTLAGTTGTLGPFTNTTSNGKLVIDSTSLALPALGTYSETEEVAITFGPSSAVAQTVQFQLVLQNSVVPEPSSLTLALIGLAGSGIVTYGLRRRKQALA